MKFIITLIFCFLIQNINAQSSYFNVKESQKYRDQFKSTNVVSVNTSSDNYTIIARMHRNTLIFETFDENANGKKMMIKTLEKKERFTSELYYDDEVKIFTINSPTKTERIINCHVYNVKNHSYKKTELFKTIVEKNRTLFSGKNKRETNFSISPNKNVIAIATDNISKYSNSYLIHVFDAKSLKLMYSKDYYSNSEKYFRSTDMSVDNNGDVYSIGKEYFSGKKEAKKKKANYSFILNKIDKDSVNVLKIELDESEYIQSLRMRFKENNLNLIGYYSEKKAFGIKGVSQFKINKKELTVIDKKKTKLPLDVYKDIYGSDASMKKDKELTNFELDHVLEDNDGNTYLVAEEFYITYNYVSTGMNGMGHMMTQFHYDDILITKFNPDGELIWGRSIFKRANMPSYNIFLKDDKLHVLLNSGKKLIKKEDGRLKVSKGLFESSALYDFVYDKEGNLVHEKIQDNTKGKTRYIPYRGKYTNGKFVMYNHSDTGKQLMLLESK